jgi:hypothetical protein
MVSRAMVEAGQTQLIIQAANKCISTYRATGTLDSVAFGIGGYEDDSRHLCVIPEVRSWCALLCQEFPVFAVIEPATVEWFLPCIADIRVVRAGKHSTLVEWPKDWYSSIEPFVQRAFELIWSISPSEAEACRLRDEMVVRCKGGFHRLGLQ